MKICNGIQTFTLGTFTSKLQCLGIPSMYIYIYKYIMYNIYVYIYTCHMCTNILRMKTSKWKPWETNPAIAKVSLIGFSNSPIFTSLEDLSEKMLTRKKMWNWTGGLKLPALQPLQTLRSLMCLCSAARKGHSIARFRQSGTSYAIGWTRDSWANIGSQAFCVAAMTGGSLLPQF